MLKFDLPKGKQLPTVVDSLSCTEGFLPEPWIELGYSYEIDQAKLQVAHMDTKKWQMARDDTYPLSFLKGSGDLKKRKAIRTRRISTVNSHIVPMSRSFFKMIEILDEFPELLERHQFRTKPFKVACVAEGPGGFMEAILTRMKSCKMTAMTLKTDETNTDFVNFLESLKEKEIVVDGDNLVVQLYYGSDGTGNIYHTKNIRSFARKSGAAHLVTADGGFQETILAKQYPLFSSETIQLTKELWHYKLILAEIVTALRVQAKGGSFVLKLFDCYTIQTARLLYLLTCVYDKVSIVKPKTSRPANSERYVVCRRYLGCPKRLLQELLAALEMLHTRLNEYFCDQLLQINLPEEFRDALRSANIQLAQQQMQHIQKAVEYHNAVKKNTKQVRKHNRRESRKFMLNHKLA